MDETKKNVIAELSMDFAVRIVKLSKFLGKNKEHVIATQILRSGTSIGANIHEGIYAQSEADFVSKLSIALKEASETGYWLRLLYKTDMLTEKQYSSLFSDNKRIMGTLAKILKKIKD